MLGACIVNDEVDYLVKGAGAMSMGFVDVLLRETDATIAIVDRGAAPGGHWNDAYPFVRLHQPATLYGLASRALGSERIDTEGVNAGLQALPTGMQVADHFHRAMEETFLPSGRVRYFPMSEVTDDGEVHPLLGRLRLRLRARRRFVDGTHFEAAIPLTHRRSFEVAPSAVCVPPNDLPRLAPGHGSFVVLGGGKTGLDCISWLIEAGAPASSITWVISRDAWWSNRRAFQTIAPLRTGTLRLTLGTSEAMANAASVDDLCDRMEAAGAWLRLDPSVQPTMFHAATVTPAELERARGIGRILREGKVLALEPGRMRLQGAAVACAPDTLFIDCTASALARSCHDRTPVFSPGRIDLQLVRFPALSQSAGLLAFIEAHVDDEAAKQSMTRTVPMIDTVADWVDRIATAMANQAASLAHPRVRAWLAATRLNPIATMLASIPPDDTEALALRERIRALAPAVAGNINRLRDALASAP
jgi:hypothetical protein